MMKKTVRCMVLVVLVLFVLAGATRKASAFGEDRRMKIINEASSAVEHLYISNVDEDHWGPDQLEDDEIIAPGHYRIFNVDDGTGHCRYDFKVVLHDHRTATRRNLNVCTMESWTITD